MHELVPGAEQIRCERAGRVTRCTAVSGNGLTGKTWTCEFETDTDSTGTAYSSTKSCWTSSRR